MAVDSEKLEGRKTLSDIVLERLNKEKEKRLIKEREERKKKEERNRGKEPFDFVGTVKKVIQDGVEEHKKKERKISKRSRNIILVVLFCFLFLLLFIFLFLFTPLGGWIKEKVLGFKEKKFRLKKKL